MEEIERGDGGGREKGRDRKREEREEEREKEREIERVPQKQVCIQGTPSDRETFSPLFCCGVITEVPHDDCSVIVFFAAAMANLRPQNLLFSAIYRKFYIFS